MFDEPFSVREGLRGESSLIYDDAPKGLRYGLREVLHSLGYRTSTAQRRIICQAMRVGPDPNNWSQSNIEGEITQLLEQDIWYKLFDALERIALYITGQATEDYYIKMNSLFADERIGYRFESDRIIRVGTDEFHAAVRAAQSALQDDERFAEALRQFDHANDFRNRRPPDWPNAIKEAVNSVEAVLQVIYNRPGVALPTILSENVPAELPGGIKRLFRSLYSQGNGTVGARHASIGGSEPTGPRAELAIHVAAALHAFAVAELDA